MSYVLEIPNVFEPLKVPIKKIESGITVLDYLDSTHNGVWIQFDIPTIVQLNGKPLWQKDYKSTVIQKNDILTLTVVIGDLISIVYFVIVVIISVALALAFAPQPPTIGDTKEPDSVFNLKGQSNKNKLGEPIPSSFGTVRNWPDLAAKSYNEYENNEQIQYSLYCLGWGSYDVTEAKFSDTPIENFRDIQMQIAKPGEQITLFRDSVVTAPSVGNIELLGPNEEDYAGISGPFVINPEGTKIDKIQIDLSLPRGLFFENQGVFFPFTVEAFFEYRKIDDDGNPIIDPELGQGVDLVETIQQTRTATPVGRGMFRYGNWITESETVSEQVHGREHNTQTITYNNNTFSATSRTITNYLVTGLEGWFRLIDYSVTLSTINIHRVTVGADVPLGRYEIRGARTSIKNTDSRVANTLVWESARGFYPNTKNYGNKTIIAVRAVATNNLNDNSRVSFNIKQTRELPIYDLETKTWSDPVPTRNPIDALFEIGFSLYGGNFKESFFDFENLMAVREDFSVNNTNFDFIYESKTNVWDAFKLALSVGRAIPLLNGSRIISIADKLTTVSNGIFTPDTMIADSFSWDMNFFKRNEYDGLEVEFTDVTTWKPRTILCLIGNDIGSNPYRLKLKGITDPDKAYREGLYRRAKQVYQREFFSFATDMEGLLPPINSLISISHDVPNYGQSGFIESYNGNTLTLSREVTLESGKSYVIKFRDKTGDEAGPYFIINTGNTTNIVTSVSDILEDLNRFNTQQSPVFILGEQNIESIKARVLSITPNADQESITLECVKDDPRIYSYDNAIAPELGDNEIRQDLDLPVMVSLFVTSVVGLGNIIQISWTPVAGASSYVVEYSYDNINFTIATKTTSISYLMEVTECYLYLRVAGINKGQGEYITWEGEVGKVTVKPNDINGLVLQSNFNGLSANIEWQRDLLASSYELEIRRQSNNALLRTVEVLNNYYSYSISEASVDFQNNPERNLKVTVKGKNQKGVSENSANLLISNPVPISPSNLSLVVVNNNENSWDLKATWNAVTDADIIKYILWGNNVSGFSLTPANLLLNGSLITHNFTISKTSAYTNYRVRVAAIDPWGNDFTPSAEASVALP